MKMASTEYLTSKVNEAMGRLWKYENEHEPTTADSLDNDIDDIRESINDLIEVLYHMGSLREQMRVDENS